MVGGNDMSPLTLRNKKGGDAVALNGDDSNSKGGGPLGKRRDHRCSGGDLDVSSPVPALLHLVTVRPVIVQTGRGECIVEQEDVEVW